MVKGDSKYIIVDYEKVVDVFLPTYQSAVVTRDVLRSMLFDENFVVSDAVKADLAGRSPTTTAAELRLAMLQFPLKQFQTEISETKNLIPRLIMDVEQTLRNISSMKYTIKTENS